MKPFMPSKHGSISVTLADVTQIITIPPVRYGSLDRQIWIDNRGASDVLIEFYDDPLDADSFRVCGYASQPLTMPSSSNSLRIKRPSGSSSAIVYITSGDGI